MTTVFSSHIKSLLTTDSAMKFRDHVKYGSSLKEIYVAAQELLSESYSKGEPLAPERLKVIQNNLRAAVEGKKLYCAGSSIYEFLNWLFSIFAYFSLVVGSLENTLSVCNEIDKILRPLVPTVFLPNGNNPILGYHQALQIDACTGLTTEERTQLKYLKIPILSEGSKAVYRREEGHIPRTIFVDGDTPYLLLNRSKDRLLAKPGAAHKPKEVINLKTGKKCILICMKTNFKNKAPSAVADHNKNLAFFNIQVKLGKFLQDCPFFAKLHSFLRLNSRKDPNSENLWLIYEYCEEGDLLNYINYKYQNKKELYQIGYDILRGIQFLHSLGYGHCDIKLENVVLYKDHTGNLRAKIIDLELAEEFGNFPLGGTQEYLAPEEGPLTDKRDIFALGKLFEFLFEYGANIQLNLIRNMIIEDPNQRPSIESCIARLEAAAHQENLQLV